MSAATILWQPTVKDGESLNVSNTEMFLLQMQTAFPERSWPMLLTVKDIPYLEGMAAATTIIGNPYLDLVHRLKRYNKGITVWPEYGEDHGI